METRSQSVQYALERANCSPERAPIFAVEKETMRLLLELEEMADAQGHDKDCDCALCRFSIHMKTLL